MWWLWFALGAEAAPLPVPLWEVKKGDVTSWLYGKCPSTLTAAEVLPGGLAERAMGARLVFTEMRRVDVAEEELKRATFSATSMRERVGDDAFFALAATAPALPAPFIDHMVPGVAQVLPIQSTAKGMSNAHNGLLAGAAERGASSQSLSPHAGAFAPQQAWSEALEIVWRGDHRDAAAYVAAMDALCGDADPSPLSDLLAEPSFRAAFAPGQAEVARGWVSTLAPELGRGDVLVVADARYFADPDGLIAGLNAAGFSVTQLAAERAPFLYRQHMVRLWAPLPPPPKIARKDLRAWQAAAVELARMSDCTTAMPEVGCRYATVDACMRSFEDATEGCVRQMAPQLGAPGPKPIAAERLAPVLSCAILGPLIDAAMLPEPEVAACGPKVHQIRAQIGLAPAPESP